MKEIYHPKSSVACVKIKQDENNNDSGITDLNINVCFDAKGFCDPGTGWQFS